jgi:hypothetical protein
MSDSAILAACDGVEALQNPLQVWDTVGPLLSGQMCKGSDDKSMCCGKHMERYDLLKASCCFIKEEAKETYSLAFLSIRISFHSAVPVFPKRFCFCSF